MKPKYKFKIGDRVKILDGSHIKNYTYGWCTNMLDHCGKIALIKSFAECDGKPCYKLENEDGKHMPFFWDERGLKKAVEEMKIIITADGVTTRARMYDGKKVVKEEKAVCSKGDNFDFSAGAMLAFQRLIKPEEKPKSKPELLNTKIFIVDGDETLKTSHVYEIKDGKIIGTTGRFPVEGNLYNMNDVHKYFNGCNDTKYNAAGEKMGGYSTQKQIKVMEVKEG